jgi:hypothetical protein
MAKADAIRRSFHRLKPVANQPFSEFTSSVCFAWAISTIWFWLWLDRLIRFPLVRLRLFPANWLYVQALAAL